MKKYFYLLFILLAFSVQARPGLLDNLGLSNDMDVPPDVDHAFILSATAQDANTLLARWEIAEGNYLYRDKISFEIIEKEVAQLQTVSLPAGENKMDEVFALTEVYQFDTDVILPITRSGLSSKITLKAYYQGCSETFHICYPPTEKEIVITLPAATSAVGNSITTAPAILNEQDQLMQKLADGELIKILLGFFGLGLLLAFTPCVFPMIPILS
ncbi:MAG: protein-disulfide reductase DsbD, partial [Proteobacteria bacterium]|nr:protein-disulfide reductase DsbD [Pseudomonadota bacterium]